jgi:hypothetical protein
MVAARLDSPVSQTRTSGFFSFKTEEDFEDSSSTSLMSSRPHSQLEEEDPVDEGTRCGKKLPSRREMSTSTIYGW